MRELPARPTGVEAGVCALSTVVSGAAADDSASSPSEEEASVSAPRATSRGAAADEAGGALIAGAARSDACDAVLDSVARRLSGVSAPRALLPASALVDSWEREYDRGEEAVGGGDVAATAVTPPFPPPRASVPDSRFAASVPAGAGAPASRSLEMSPRELALEAELARLMRARDDDEERFQGELRARADDVEYHREMAQAAEVRAARVEQERMAELQSAAEVARAQADAQLRDEQARVAHADAQLRGERERAEAAAEQLHDERARASNERARVEAAMEQQLRSERARAEAAEAAARQYARPYEQTAAAAAAAAQEAEERRANTALLKTLALRLADKPAERPRPIVLPWASEFATAALQRYGAPVDTQQCCDNCPDPSNRELYKSFLDRTSNGKLLRVFTDDLDMIGFLDEYKNLLGYLYTIVLTSKSADVGERHVRQVLQASLEWSSTAQGKHTRLISAKRNVAPSSSVTEVLRAVEQAFVAPSATAGHIEYDKAIAALTIDQGWSPSASLSKMIQLTATHLNKAQDSDHVWKEVKWRWEKSMHEQSVAHAFLAPITDKLCDPDFSQHAGSERWNQFIRSVEYQTRFQAGLKDAIGTAQGAGAGGSSGGGAGAGGGGASVGGGKKTKDKSLPLAEVPPVSLNSLSAAVLQQMVSDGTLSASVLQQLQSDGSLPAGVNSLQAAMAANGGALLGGGGGGPGSQTGSQRPSWGDETWVQQQGTLGKPAPLDRDRPPLHTVKVLQALGIPHDPAKMAPNGVLVGEACPACAFKNRIKTWYVRQGQRNAEGSGAVVGDRPPGSRDTAYVHLAEKCVVMYEQLHRHVRSHPDQAHLFDPLPAGQDHRSLAP